MAVSMILSSEFTSLANTSHCNGRFLVILTLFAKEMTSKWNCFCWTIPFHGDFRWNFS